MSETEQADRTIYDALVIGAGICGIIFLKYARDKNLRCLVLEKHPEIGGVWSWLPSWQDIQNRKEDFALNEVRLDGVRQPDVLAYVQEWVREYDLEPFIRRNCEVTSVSWRDGGWNVETNRGALRARYVIAATGVQNEPWIPDIERSDSEVVEMHSSELQRPEDLAGKRVTVVGGGTSSWDLLDLAIENDAKDIHWVHRSIKWFMPTKTTKQTLWPNLREMALHQSISRSSQAVNAFLRWLLKVKFDHFRVHELEPDEPFDVQRHQLVPGRSTMLQNLDAISRHCNEIRQVRDKEVVLENGERFGTDILLWGTGYRMNLAYLGLPEYNRIDKISELAPKLGSLVRATDYPNLFFIGMSLIESTSSTPFFAAVEAKSIVAHILGECAIPKRTVPHLIAHWDLLRHFAGFDRANYPKFWWRIKYFLLAVWYAILHDRSVRV